jgi:nicotinate-nucleotide adenylyltransferase
MSEKLRLGLFGGSFDPVHCGHLQLALAAQKEFKLQKVVFVPARRPPHKKDKELLPAGKRVRMLSLALAPYPGMSISSFELRRKQTTYTYQTLRHFRRKFPDADLFFIIGSDSLNELSTWKRSDLLFTLCRFIVGRRKGSRPRRTGTAPADFLAGCLPAISSSGIRDRVRQGRSIKGLVPPVIERYIRTECLYR